MGKSAAGFGSSLAGDTQVTLCLLHLDLADFSAFFAKRVDKRDRKMGGERPKWLNIHGNTFS